MAASQQFFFGFDVYQDLGNLIHLLPHLVGHCMGNEVPLAHGKVAPDDHMKRRDVRVAANLAAAGFSLWRAVFLTETSDKQMLLKSIDIFLGRVIKDNTILYGDDKNVWSLGYYTENGRNGLLQIEHVIPPAYRAPLRKFATKLEGPDPLQILALNEGARAGAHSRR